LLEAYTRLGRAYGYHNDFADARSWFQTARALAERWCVDEPQSAEARAMLGWIYRKIADIGKLSGDLDAARADYGKAIAVGRESLKAHPADREAKTHLAKALNDLAGVHRLRRELLEASPLYAEAERFFEELIEADPENADTRFFLIHAQHDLAQLLRDLGRFSEAGLAYRRAIDNLSRFPLERLVAPPPHEFLRVEVLKRNLADCESATLALGPLAVLQSKPARQACPLLLARVRLLIALDRAGDALDAVEAVCSLAADTVEDSNALIRALGECTRILDDLRTSGPTEARRLAVQHRCAARKASLVARAGRSMRKL
jgi:tetratricopeptide (TPR) repeat protein